MRDVITPSYDDWVFPFRCDKCDTEAVGEAVDLRKAKFKTSGYHFAGTAVIELLYYFYCPNCNAYVFVDQNQIPTGLQLQTVDEDG